MARETVTRLVDDLDGGVAHETVRFGLDGRTYEIDLSTKNAKKFRSELAVYIEHSARVPSHRLGAPGRARTGRTTRGALTGKNQNRAIREWAQTNGYDIAERGRIRQEIVEAFQHTAHS